MNQKGNAVIPLNDKDLLVIENGNLNNTVAPLEKAVILSIKILNQK